jgi:hypothetical protein
MEEKIEDYYEIMNLPDARKKFDVVELSKKIKRKGDVLILSKELKIRPRALQLAVDEGRILSMFPKLDKSKAASLCSLRTDRELKLFSEKYDIYNISARDLIKLVRKWNHDVEANPMILVSQEEHDLIIGSLLGDASIRQREKNSCFRVAHSVKQESYINIKLNILRNFNISEFDNRTRVINGREVNMIYLATKTHPVFNYYRNLFYKDGIKNIDLDILNKLNPRSLAYWICDDGSYSNKQGYMILCTNSFSFDEHKLIKKFFNDKFGLDPTIGFRDGKYYYLRFKQQDTKKLIEIIKPFIPNSMKYKIGEKNE